MLDLKSEPPDPLGRRIRGGNERRTMQFASFFEVEPGVELYYEGRGHGDPIVFVPGWTASAGAFVHQVSHFSETNRVTTFDPRSVGRSTITLQPIN